VNLGNGVVVTKKELDGIKTMSISPSKFALNLMRLLFTDEELQNRSLFARKCSANKNSVVHPAIDSARRDAIICRAFESSLILSLLIV
jgi:hypothetical protein